MTRRRSSPSLAHAFLSRRLDRLETRTAPAVFRWDGQPDAGGASPDNKWTTATNWVGDVAPPPGSDLEFGAGGVAQFANVNDFPAGTAFRSITFAGYGFDITGNRVVLSAGVNANLPVSVSGPIFPPYLTNGPFGIATSLANPRLGIDVTLAAPQTFLNATVGNSAQQPGVNITGTIDLKGQLLTVIGSVAFTGRVIGAGGLVKDGGGTLELWGDNSYTGVTGIRAGQIRTHSSTALGAT